LKKFGKILTVIAVLAIVSLSCTKLDLNPNDGMGTLTLANASYTTVQKIMINGVSYGTLDPGAKKDIKLSPGVYSWQLVGISGGTGCSAASLTVLAGYHYSYECRG
jgi:hypothetical protein